MTAPNYRVRTIKCGKKIKFSFLYFLKKSQKTSYLENYNELSCQNWSQDSQSLRVPRQRQLQGWECQKTCKNNKLKKLKHGEIVKPAFKFIIGW